MPCTAPIITLLEPFRCLFTAPTWQKMLRLLRGTLLARGRRTVRAALWHTGHEQDPHFSGFHHVLNRARWSPLAASRQLLRRIIETFIQAGGTLDIVIDETLERRWGAKIRTRGHYRASARSRHERSVSSPGLRWIVDRAGTRGGEGTLDQAALGVALAGGSGKWLPRQRSAVSGQRSARSWGSVTKRWACGRAKWSVCCGAGGPECL
jgi:hypothetical protein